MCSKLEEAGMKKVFLKKIGFSLFVAAAALLWTTCEVGLGEAVDNEAPTLSVTGPVQASVHKSDIEITGTCADDKGVKSVNIVLNNTGTGKSYSYNGEIDFSAKSASGSYDWKKTVCVEGEDYGILPDGTYVANVTVTDINGRLSGVSSATFDIDHTAPVFCVTSPSTLDITNPRKYGRSVTISGEISDDHEVEKMEIRVFKTDASGSSVNEITESLPKTVFTGFETAGGTTIYIAKYFESESGLSDSDKELLANYNAIYNGTTLGQNVYIYIVPILTDSVGNTSKFCYSASGVKKAIADACGVNTTIDSMQTAQLQRIFNGTYTYGELNAAQQEKALAILNGDSAVAASYFCGTVPDDAENNAGNTYYLAASVNSNNSPTYDFNGYENPVGSWVGVNTGGIVTITLKAGLDNWGVLPNTLKVHLYKSDSSGSKGAIEFSSDAAKDPNGSATVIIRDSSNKETKEINTAVTNQSYYVTMPSLKSGNHYLLEAEGKDENESVLEPVSAKYGFKVASSITPPSLSAENDLFYIKASAAGSSGDYKLRLNVKDEADEIKTNGVVVRGAIYAGHISSKIYVNNYTALKTQEKTYTESGISQDSDNNYHIDLAIKDFGFTVGSEDNYTVVLSAYGKYKDADGNVVPTSYENANPSVFMFWLDNKAPLVSVRSPADSETLITENFSSYEESESEGSFITPAGTWSDSNGSGTHRLWWTADDIGTPTLNWQEASGTFVSGTNYYEKQATNCYALLDTDKFVAGSTSVSGYYTLTLNPSQAGKTWTEVEGISQSASQTSWEQKISVEQGVSKIFRLAAVDAVGNLSEPVGKTDLKYDFAVPKIALESEPASNGYYNLANASEGKITVTATVTDSYKVEASGVIVTATKDGAEVSNGSSGYTLTKTQSDDKSVLATIELASGGTSDGEWKFKIEASDAAGRAAQPIEWTRIVDTVPPSFEAFSATGNDDINGKKIAVGSGSDKSKWTNWEDSWYSSTGLVFNGNILEATSGLDKISYRLKAVSSAEEITGQKTVGASPSATALSQSLTANGFEQSVRDGSGNLTSNKIYIKAVDKAGNESAEELLVINIDQSSPIFAAAYYTYESTPLAADLSAAEGTVMSDGSKDMTVYGTVSSPLSGLEGLSWTIASLTVSPAITFTKSALSGKDSYLDAEWKALGSGAGEISASDSYGITGWKAVISAANLGAGEVNVTATSLAKRSVRTQIFTIDSDTEAPKITLNTPDTKIAAYKATAAGASDPTPPAEKADGTQIPDTAASVNGTIKISGNVSDNKELSSVKIYWSLNGDAEIDENRADKPDTEISDIGSSMYNWSISGYQFSKLNDEKTKFLFADGTQYDGTPQTLYIKVAATDKAANQTICVYEYSIDPDSDRPKITMTVPDDLTARNANDYVWKKNTAVVRGKVEDDDGLTGLKLYYNDNGETDAFSADGLKWTELSLTSGVFELFNQSGTDYDGKHKLLFKVVDADGTAFVSGAGGDTVEYWLRPKIVKQASDSSGYYGAAKNDDTSIYIEIDTNKPTVYARYYSTDATPDISNSTSSLGTVGGTRNAFNVFFYAYDKSGLDEDKITLTLNGNTYSKASSPAGASLAVSDITDEQLALNPALEGCSLVTVSGISVVGFDSGSYSGTIKVFDKAEMERSETITVVVDNTEPVVTSIAPSQTQAVSGEISAYGTVDGAKQGGLSYALTYTDDSHNRETEPSLFIDIKQKSSLMWYVYFDGGETTDEETHGPTLTNYIINNDVTIGGDKASDVTIQNRSFTAKVDFYIWIKAVDEVGNETIEKFPIKFDPLGNMPEVTITNPDDDGEKFSGEFKVFGSAKANDTSHPVIQAVYAQVISNAHDLSSYAGGTSFGSFAPSDGLSAITAFEFKANDLDYLKAAGYTIYNMSTGLEASSGWTDSTAANYGVKANVSGRSWSILLNNDSKGELDSNSGTNAAAIRVYAFDGANLSLPETKAFVIDSDSPQLKNVYLEQYENGVNESATASREYEEEMYVKGKWYLTFTLSDGDALGVIKIGKGQTAQIASGSGLKTYLEYKDGSYTTDVDGTVAKCHASGNHSQIDIKYPLDTESGVGTEYVYVYYEDTSGKGGDEVAKTYKISYDNLAPVLALESDEKYAISAVVRQSNGLYSLGSKVSEANAADGTKQSGFARLAFYFTRGDYIFDPMIKKGADGNKIGIAASNLISENGLYWKKQTVTRDSQNLDSITITDDDNIHAGGLVKLGGAIYIIKAKTGAQITIDGQPKDEYTEALFAIANVVDNEIQESDSGAERKVSNYGFGYSAPRNDDGDLMIESIQNVDTDWTWNASIYSKNIPDGPVEIHYVAFDKAENWTQAGGVNSEGTTISDPPVVEAVVSNNRPRIANLYVGTDLNGDNAISVEEMSEPYAASSLTWNQDTNSGSAVTDAVLGSADAAYLTIKGMTTVTPEILGGNGNVYYGFDIKNNAGTRIVNGSNATPFIASGQVMADPLADETSRSGAITIQVGDLTSDALRTGGIPDCGEDAPHQFVFAFYDETEDATGAARSGSGIFDAARTDAATATIWMAVNMGDNEQPKAAREELFWNGKGAGDDEGNPLNSVAWDGSTPLGHIDLSDDLPAAFSGAAKTINGTTYPAAVMDTDSKVSGKIVLRGTVSDNKLLYKIYLKIPQMAARFAAAGLESDSSYGYCAATYNASAGDWTQPASTESALLANGIHFTVTNNKIKSSGHTADWEFIWDTSYIDNVAATNVTVDIYASDQVLKSSVDNANGSLTSLNGTTKYLAPVPTRKNVSTGTNKPDTLQVDVVPYITGLTTFLSKKGVQYARTALGHWPIWKRTDSPTAAGNYANNANTTKESFAVQGFNFSQGNVDLTGQTQDSSGPFVKTINSVPSLNNINDNSKEYNQQPNGKNNNILKDNVYIDVWQLNGKAAVPSALKIETPTMKINPSNGMIGFAFRYGQANREFAMPNGTTNSYVYWNTGADIQNSVTFNYDSSGQTYGTSAAGDSGSGYSDFFSFYSSIWGVSGYDTNGNSSRDRIEMTGQKGQKSMTPASYSADYNGAYSNSASGSTEYANEKTKHQSPVIATAGTKVYLAYYDSFNQEIRFRTSREETFTNNSNGQAVGDFVDQYTNYRSITDYNYTNCQIVAQENTPVTGGEYVGLAAKSDGVAMVWYGRDNSSGLYKMWYSYNSSPDAERRGSINSQRAADVATNGWSVPYDVFAKKGKSVSGEYCKVAFDAGGHVHIAAYDSASGDVWYAYISDPTTPSGAVVCRVDADGSVGENLTLDVALDSSGAAIPVIGYYNASRSLPKLARLAKAGDYGDGAISGKFTGIWEVACVPTDSAVEQDNINVGVWKDGNGKIKNSTANNAAVYASANNNVGICYGNGTQNPVLGYRHSGDSIGYIETAQLTGTPDSVYQDNDY